MRTRLPSPSLLSYEFCRSSPSSNSPACYLLRREELLFGACLSAVWAILQQLFGYQRTFLPRFHHFLNWYANFPSVCALSHPTLHHPFSSSTKPSPPLLVCFLCSTRVPIAVLTYCSDFILSSPSSILIPCQHPPTRHLPVVFFLTPLRIHCPQNNRLKTIRSYTPRLREQVVTILQPGSILKHKQH